MLQKKLKLFGSLLVLASFSISIAWTSTSCGDDGNSNPDEFSDFICDRSFSIAIQVPSDDPRYYSYSLGTAWIFEKTDAIGFEYYMATNIHVSIPFDQQYIDSNSSMLLGYNKDYHINNSLNLTSEYAKIARANWTLLGTTADTRPNIGENSISTYGYECDVDFNVFRVNFGSEADIARVDPYDSSDQPAHSPLLNRLKKLNTEALDGTTATDGKTITPFADSSYPIGGKNLHVAGFPKRPADKSDGRPQWTYYATKCAITHFSYAPDKLNPLQHNPLIEKMKDNVPIAILGKEIGYTKYKTPHLTGGSSGSLVINDQKQAVAINYAGIPNDKETDSIQSFALVLRCNYGNYQYDVLSDEYFGGLL